MEKNKKVLSVLSTAAVAGLIVSAISTPASAKASAIDVNTKDGKVYEYQYQALKDSAMAWYLDKTGADAALYNNFLTNRASIAAYFDDVNKDYVGFDTLSTAILNGTVKDLATFQTFMENKTTPTTTLTPSAVTADASGNITVTPSDPSKVVTSVSAITTSTNAGIVPILPSTVNVTLGDGTTKAVAITWSTAATTASTYANAGTVTVNGTLADYNNYAVSATVTVSQAALGVSSVTSPDAKTLKIVFAKPVSSTHLITSTGLLDTAVGITKIGTAGTITPGTETAKLSDDKTTLTVVAQNDEIFDGSYRVTVEGTLAANKVTGINGETMSNYDQVLTFKDTTRPTISAPTYPANKVARFKLSEPILGTTAATFALQATDVEGAMTITDSTGKVISSTGTVTVNNTDGTFDVSLAGTSFAVGKTYTVTFNALKDFAGNLITPNPVSYQVTVKNDDTTAPTVQSLVAVQPGKMKVTFSEPVDTTVPTFAYSIGGTTHNFVFSGASTNTTVDSTGTVLTVTDNTNLTGLVGVTITNYKDLSGNLGDDYTKTLNFGADTTAPTLVSSQVTTIGTDQYLIANFSENVTVQAVTNALVGTYVDSNSITHSVNVPIANASLYNMDVDGNSKSVKIKLYDDQGTPVALPKGNYSMKLQAGAVKDLATNPVAQTAVAFTIGDVTPTTAPKIVDSDSNPVNGYDGISATNNTDPKTVTIVFDEPLSASTALNVANYTVEGQQVFQSAVFDSNNYTVKLTLKPGAITLTGARQLAVANVTNASGVAMQPVTTNVAFTENVAPTVKSATLTDAGTITVKFSEAVSADTTADFDVYVNGQKVTVTEGTTSATDTMTLTIPALTNLTTPVKITVVSGNDVKDAAGNALSTTGDITVTQ